MTQGPRLLSTFVIFLLVSSAVAQQSGSADPPAAPSTKAAPAPQQSLADVARKLRKDKPAEVRMTDADTKELFRSVNKVLQFARGHRFLGAPRQKQIVDKSISKSLQDRLREDFSRRFARSELTMHKFGLLPRDFNLREFLVKANGQSIAGLYDDETKTISLLNTVSMEKQGPILAHELTHALQDQNYDLLHWAKAGSKAGKSGEQGDIIDESTTARHAIVEGQAMVVYLDYLLAPFGRNLKDTPGVVASMEDTAVSATIDTELMHRAPMVLREAGSFPYRDGLFFEADILAQRGKQAAFQGVFAQPPRNTHEVFDSRAYLERAKLTPVEIPDVASLVGKNYESFDSGSFGELDVRALLKQFGDKHGATDFAPAWAGGTYVAFKRTQVPGGSAHNADVALLYVSRWKTAQAAEHFARFYATMLQTATRMQSSGPAHMRCGSLSDRRGIGVDRGRPGHRRTWSITRLSFQRADSETAARLSAAIRSPSGAAR
jgi:hypothetical protein